MLTGNSTEINKHQVTKRQFSGQQWTDMDEQLSSQPVQEETGFPANWKSLIPETHLLKWLPSE
jgi:hypothetical protein